MKEFKNFTQYEITENSKFWPVYQKHNALFLQDENGNDWYDVQKEFHPDTIKIVYDLDGFIVSFSTDATGLFPLGNSVIEFEREAVPGGLSLNGYWYYLNERIVCFKGNKE